MHPFDIKDLINPIIDSMEGSFQTREQITKDGRSTNITDAVNRVADSITEVARALYQISNKMKG